MIYCIWYALGKNIVEMVFVFLLNDMVELLQMISSAISRPPSLKLVSYLKHLFPFVVTRFSLS